MNPNFTWDDVKSDKLWQYWFISLNPNITWDIVRANPDKPWNYDGLSQNPNITWDIMKLNPDKPWNYNLLSKYTYEPKLLLETLDIGIDLVQLMMAISSNPMDQPALKQAVERQVKRTLEIKEELMMKTYLIM